MTADVKATYAKPLPTRTRDGAPFWAAAQRGELHIQHCPACDRHQFPPRRLCMHCGGRDVHWRRVSGTGRVYSFTIVHRAPEPAFVQDVPYVVAVVELAEGGRMMTNLVGCAPSQARVDMPVVAVFERVTPDVTLVKFRPADA
jgi:uncharacterized protein